MKKISEERFMGGRKDKGEQVGAGYFVFRRGGKSKRIRPSTLSFEHADIEAAQDEAFRLAKLHPEKTFEVYARVMKIMEPAPAAE